MPMQEDTGVPFTEISIIFLEGITRKISYERRAYELINDKSVS